MGYLRFLHRFLAPAGAVAALACGGDDLVLPTGGTDGSPTSSPTVLQMVTGDDQVGAPGSPLSQPVVVKLLDQEGNAMPDQRVAWVISAGGAPSCPRVPPPTERNGLRHLDAGVGRAQQRERGGEWDRSGDLYGNGRERRW